MKMKNKFSTKDQIEFIINNIEISDNEIVLLQGKKTVPFFSGNEQYPSSLKDILSDIIYEDFYCKGTLFSSNENFDQKTNRDSIQFFEEIKSFSQNLSKANTTEEGFHNYWEVIEKINNGDVLVAKNGFKRIVSSGEYIYKKKSFSLNESNYVDLLKSKESLEVSNSFYYVFGETLEFDSNSFLVRFYFNLKPEGASKLIEQITTEFNKKIIPFQFKCLNHPDYYGRTDAGVLYLSKAYANIGWEVISDFMSKSSNVVNEGIPLFTLPLFKGVGFAESPPRASVSFGKSRADIISEAIAQSFQKVNSKENRLDEISYMFSQKGLNIDELYLNSNANYPYSFIKEKNKNYANEYG